MSSDVVINIFGKISNPEAIWNLAMAIASEGMLEWTTPINLEDVLSILEEAEARAEPLTLTRSDTKDLFDGVTYACREAGLSYVVHFGETGAEGFSDGFSWKPGMERDFEFALSGDEPSISLRELEKAVALGLDQVKALLERVAGHSRVGVIEIEPGFREQYIAEYAGPRPEKGARGARM